MKNYKMPIPTIDHFKPDQYKRILLRAGIIIGVLMVSILLAVKFPRMEIILLLLALISTYVGVQILSRWPSLGLVVLVVGTYLVKQGIGPVNITIVLLIGLTGFWLFDMMTRQKDITIISSPTFTPLALLTLIVLIAFLLGQFPWFPVPGAPIGAQIGGVLIFICAVLAFVLGAHQIKNLNWLKAIVGVFVGLGAGVLSARFFPPLLPYVRPFFSDGALGSLFWLWIVAFTFSNGLYNKNLKWPWRVVLLLFVGATMYNAAILNQSWSSGWVPALAAMGVIFWVGKPRYALPVTVVALLLMVQLGYVEAIFQDLVYGSNEYSTTTRLGAWKIMIEIIKANPILGVGPANYYWYTPLYNIFGFYRQFNSHHNLFDIAAQVGLLGLACFLWFFWAIGKLCFSLRTSVPQGGFTHAYVLASLGGIVGMLVATNLGDWVIPFFYNVGVHGFRAAMFGWLFLGGLVAIEQMVINNILPEKNH